MKTAVIIILALALLAIVGVVMWIVREVKGGERNWFK